MTAVNLFYPSARTGVSTDDALAVSIELNLRLEAKLREVTADAMRLAEERDDARADFANACDVGRRQEARAEKAERERDEACQKEREGCARICDLEFAANWHSAAMAAANAAKRCAELIRAADEPHTREPKENSQ